MIGKHRENGPPFDTLMLKFIEGGSPVFIDTGASSGMRRATWMQEVALAKINGDEGFDLRLHVVIAGGPALPFTLKNFTEIYGTSHTDAQIVVWLNR